MQTISFQIFHFRGRDFVDAHFKHYACLHFYIKFIQLLEKLFNICRIIVNKSSSAIKTYTYRNVYFSERTRTKCSNLLLLRKLYKNKS